MIARVFSALLLVPLALTSGCIPWSLFDDDHDRPPSVSNEPTPPPDPVKAPSVESIDIPDWPPLGPDGEISIDVSDDVGLSSADVLFRNPIHKDLSGTGATFKVTGPELGEGLGTLQVRVDDIEGAHASRNVTDLLVDLSPPTMDIGKRVLRANGEGEGAELEVWVADAWVLGEVELTFQGTTLTYDFQEGYPSTLGQAWHYSLVQFPTKDLPEGGAAAQRRVAAPAGNTPTPPFDVVLDGKAPSLSVLSPADGATVSGAFDVELSAWDEGGGAAWIDLRIAGTSMATAVGPTATVTLDAAELAAGEVELEAVAFDEAGNASDPVTLTLLVE